MQNAAQVQVIALSATLSNHAALGRWLHATVYNSSARDVDLKEYIVVGARVMDATNSNVRILSRNHPKGVIAELCLDKIRLQKSVLIFCPSKRKCAEYTKALSESLPSSLGQIPVCLITWIIRGQCNHSLHLVFLDCWPFRNGSVKLAKSC